MHFGGTSGRLLLRCEDRMTLYEQQSRKVLADLQVSKGNAEAKTGVATVLRRSEKGGGRKGDGG